MSDEFPSALPMFAGNLLTATVRSEHPEAWRLLDAERGVRFRPVRVDQRWQWVQLRPSEP